MDLSGNFALNSVLRRYMFGALRPVFRSLATLKLVVNVVGCRRTLNRKEQLWHRAVSLRQLGFHVKNCHMRHVWKSILWKNEKVI